MEKTTSEYDPSTIVHELTHMLTHDILVNSPIWINEGYAECICHIPIKNDAFQTDKKSIREGIQNMFFDYHVRSVSRNRSKKPKFGKTDKMNPLSPFAIIGWLSLAHYLL